MSLLVVLNIGVAPRYRGTTISKSANSDLPFLNPADTIVPYIVCINFGIVPS